MRNNEVLVYVSYALCVLYVLYVSNVSLHRIYIAKSVKNEHNLSIMLADNVKDVFVGYIMV